MLVPRRLRIEKEVIVRIRRNLNGRGKLSASLGQEVRPEEIIGIGEFSGGFTTLNLSQALEVSAREVEKALRKSLGSRIYKGELLAYKSGWLLKKAKYITSPIDGIFDFLNRETGEIRITRMPEKTNLPAGVYGVVEEVDESLGQVTIRTQVSRVWGVCGSGRVREGILEMISRRGDLLEKKVISPKFEGHILVNGSLIQKESIMMGISNGINGIITGGINASDYKSIAGGRLIFPKKLENDIGLSLLVCEGFGSLPLGEDIYELLLEHKDRFVTIDGNHTILNLPAYQSSCMNKIRKTKLPKVADSDFNQISLVDLTVGQKVRAVGTSYASEQGKVVAIDRSKTLLGSGISSYLITVVTNRRKIQVPTNNLEVI